MSRQKNTWLRKSIYAVSCALMVQSISFQATIANESQDAREGSPAPPTSSMNPPSDPFESIKVSKPSSGIQNGTASAPQDSYTDAAILSSRPVLDRLLAEAPFNEEQRRVYWETKVRERPAVVTGNLEFASRNRVYLWGAVGDGYLISAKIELNMPLSDDEFLNLEQGSKQTVGGLPVEIPSNDDSCPWFEIDEGHSKARERRLAREREQRQEEYINQIFRGAGSTPDESRDSPKKHICLSLSRGRVLLKQLDRMDNTHGHTPSRVSSHGIKDETYECDQEPNTFLVSGSAIWTEAKLQIPANSTLLFEVGGNVSPNGIRWTDPNGHSDGTWNRNYNLYDVINHAGLVGKIGKGGEVFAIGSNAQVPSNKGGLLYLGINDSRPQDNEGEFEVDVRVCR